MNDKPTLLQQHSPTGDPVLPQWAVRLLTGVVLTAGAAVPFLPDGSPHQKVALFIVSLGAAFGIVSQGVRR
jgi:hypothetical protein